jgi:DNA-binding XRE family transcriptional regulator
LIAHGLLLRIVRDTTLRADRDGTRKQAGRLDAVYYLAAFCLADSQVSTFRLPASKVCGMSTKEAYGAERQAYLDGFAANVKRLRAEHDPPLSQTGLCNATGLHRTEIGKIENGEVEPRLATLALLAAGLGVKIDEMIQGLPLPRERKPPPARRS